MAQSKAPARPKVPSPAGGLRYSRDGERGGFRRRNADRGVEYVDDDGAKVTDAATLERIKLLVIPPAWIDVWICRDERGHLQATGRDARGRKQYRYHARWREVRDDAKYGKLLIFARVLPLIRARVEED